MKAVWSMVKLTLRGALRERVVWSMFVLLLGVLLLLPMGLKGDGTLEGDIRMQVRYGLGLSTALLAAMTVWMSCAAIAGDLSTKRLHLVLVKPVGRARIWLGKWLAVTGISWVLLLACGAVVFTRIQVRLRGADPVKVADLRDRVITSRAPVRPVPVDLSVQVQEMLEKQKAQGLPPDIPMDAVLDQLTGIARSMRYSAASGSEVTWEFELATPLGEQEALQLAYRYDGASMGVGTIRGEWQIGTDTEPDLTAIPVRETPYREFVLRLNQEGAYAGATHIRVTFQYLDDQYNMLFFDPDDGVLLYRPAGDFGPNLFRALLLLAGLLALLAALGVSAGAMFSLPVACYLTAVLLLIHAGSGTVFEAARTEALSGGGDEVSFTRILDQLSSVMYQGLAAVLKPLELNDPLDRVARGVQVPWTEVGRQGGLHVFPGLILLGLTGIWLFRKREAGGAE